MRKILVVDDEPDIVELVQSRLEANAYNVITAEDGRQGIQRALSELPDLILMDIMMPNLSGGDAALYLRSKEQTKHIPIVFFTGVCSSRKPEGKEPEGVNVGGENYPFVGKPFDPDRLLSEIQRHID